MGRDGTGWVPGTNHLHGKSWDGAVCGVIPGLSGVIPAVSGGILRGGGPDPEGWGQEKREIVGKGGTHACSLYIVIG